jgi:hypothetical protein
MVAGRVLNQGGPMQQTKTNLMKTGSIVGLILFVSGIVSLLCFVSPLRLLADAIEPHEIRPLFAILGGLALIGGVALLAAGRPRKSGG